MNKSIEYGEDFESKDLGEIMFSKFKSLAKEYFQLDISAGIDREKILKESGIFFGFNLPAEINEMFIRFEDAPLFWVYRSPLISQLEEFYKFSLSNLSGRNYYKTVRDFYLKWVLINSTEEKRYFSSSAINYIDKRSNNNNVLHLIFHAMILAYDEYFYDPLKSFELLERAKEVITQSNLNSEIKNELMYLLNVYEGFVFLKQNEYKLAQNYFNAALPVKPNSITAKFYISYTSALIENDNLSEEFLSEIFNYDIARIEYCIEKNNLEMVEYFLKFPLFSNLLTSRDLPQSFDAISNFLRDVKGAASYDLNTLKANINNFKNLNLEEYYSDVIVSSTSYLDKILQNYSKNENVIFKGASEKLHNKFTQILDSIINKIKEKYNNQISAKLQIYENEIQNKLNEIQQYSKEREESKAKIKERTAKTITSIEKRTTDNIAIIEEKINSLQFIPNFDPKAAFQNAMTYNLILSFTVFLLGGCAGYTNSSLTGIGSLNSAMAIILVNGLKWGVIAFSIGLLISLITAGLAAFEGSSQKQKLLQSINNLKKEKDYQIEYFKKEAELSEKLSEERFNKSIEDKKRYIDKLRSERDAQDKKYRDEATKNMDEECKPILKLMEV